MVPHNQKGMPHTPNCETAPPPFQPGPSGSALTPKEAPSSSAASGGIKKRVILSLRGLLALFMVAALLFTGCSRPTPDAKSSAEDSSSSSPHQVKEAANRKPPIKKDSPEKPPASRQQPTSTEAVESPFYPELGKAFPQLGLSFGEGVPPVDYDWMEPIPQWTGTSWDASWMYLNVTKNGQWAVVKFDDPHTILIEWYSGQPMWFCNHGYLHNLPPSITSAGSISSQNAALASRGFPFETHSPSNCSRFNSVGLTLNDFMAMEANGKYGYYSQATGGMITGYDYDLVWPHGLASPGFFSNGYCPVSRDGLFGYINTNGAEAVPVMFDGATHVMSHWSWVKFDNLWWQVYLN